jgi:hypothetical protein
MIAQEEPGSAEVLGFRARPIRRVGCAADAFDRRPL